MIDTEKVTENETEMNLYTETSLLPLIDICFQLEFGLTTLAFVFFFFHGMHH